jgi:membrane-associated phospholipid phosphatase
MLILGLVGGAGLIGLAVATMVRRWPSKDPSAPRLATSEIRATVHRHPRLRAHLRSRFDPAVATGLALTAAVLTFVAAATVIGVLAAMARTNSGLAQYDPRIATWAAGHATTSSTPALRFISQFGGALVVIPLAVIVAVIESLRLRSRAVWAFLLLVVGGQFLLANSIKFFVDRARPTIDQLTGFSGKSFPSGHATAAAATYLAFALLLGIRRSRNTRAISAGSAVAVAIVIAGTRVLLGVHWLTDVVAGLILGWAWFAVCSLAFGGRFLRFGAPVEIAEQATNHETNTRTGATSEDAAPVRAGTAVVHDTGR